MRSERVKRKWRRDLQIATNCELICACLLVSCDSNTNTMSLIQFIVSQASIKLGSQLRAACTAASSDPSEGKRAVRPAAGDLHPSSTEPGTSGRHRSPLQQNRGPWKCKIWAGSSNTYVALKQPTWNELITQQVNIRGEFVFYFIRLWGKIPKFIGGSEAHLDSFILRRITKVGQKRRSWF